MASEQASQTTSENTKTKDIVREVEKENRKCNVSITSSTDILNITMIETRKRVHSNHDEGDT